MRYISAVDNYEDIYWFCVNTLENKMLQYFTETSESHVGYFQLWRHILRHLRHLLALCWKSHKPPFRLAQLTCIFKRYQQLTKWDSILRTFRVKIALKFRDSHDVIILFMTWLAKKREMGVEFLWNVWHNWKFMKWLFVTTLINWVSCIKIDEYTNAECIW